jgi:Metallo-beta-lactamase superfamily
MTDPIVTIRMYKGLLGDCFLVRITEGDQTSNILIDCGVLQGTKDGTVKMAAIADDIITSTGGSDNTPGRLDLLVVTHEHWDHISGFSQAQSAFFDPKRLIIDNLWMGWTEKPGDEQAKALREKFHNKTSALVKIAELAKAKGDSLDGPAPRLAMASKRALNNLQNFMTPPPVKRMNGVDIMERLRQTAKNNGEDSMFCEPGETRAIPGSKTVKVHVLGPPRDETLLFKDLPGKGDGNAHISATAFNEDLLVGLDGNGADGWTPSSESPFSKRYCSPALATDTVASATYDGTPDDVDAGIQLWLRQHYFDRKPPCRFAGQAIHSPEDCKRDLICGADQERRRIDGDWLDVAGALAIKLDSDTNNTSLALAFALPDRSYLLFAADAQVGNWESWASQKYEEKTIDNILAATRFYKVGHHGSHNATLIDYLKKMDASKLVAMIPTDEAFAKEQGRAGWKMPDPVVRDPLIEQTKGRVLYGDREWGMLPVIDGKAAEPDKAIAAHKPDEAFLGRITQTPLYVEYRVLG